MSQCGTYERSARKRGEEERSKEPRKRNNGRNEHPNSISSMMLKRINLKRPTSRL